MNQAKLNEMVLDLLQPSRWRSAADIKALAVVGKATELLQSGEVEQLRQLLVAKRCHQLVENIGRESVLWRQVQCYHVMQLMQDSKGLPFLQSVVSSLKPSEPQQVHQMVQSMFDYLLNKPTAEQLAKSLRMVQDELTHHLHVALDVQNDQLMQMVKFMSLLHNRYHVMSGKQSPFQSVIDAFLRPEERYDQNMHEQAEATDLTPSQSSVNRLSQLLSISSADALSALQRYGCQLNFALRMELARVKVNEGVLVNMCQEYAMRNQLLTRDQLPLDADINMEEVKIAIQARNIVKRIDALKLDALQVADIDSIILDVLSLHENFIEDCPPDWIKLKQLEMLAYMQMTDGGTQQAMQILKQDIQPALKIPGDDVWSAKWLKQCTDLLLTGKCSVNLRELSLQIEFAILARKKVGQCQLTETIGHLLKVFQFDAENEDLAAVFGIDQLLKVTDVASPSVADANDQVLSDSMINDALNIETQHKLSAEDIDEVMAILGCSRTEAIMLLDAYDGDKSAAVSSIFN